MFIVMIFYRFSPPTNLPFSQENMHPVFIVISIAVYTETFYTVTLHICFLDFAHSYNFFPSHSLRILLVSLHLTTKKNSFFTMLHLYSATRIQPSFSQNAQLTYKHEIGTFHTNLRLNLAGEFLDLGKTLLPKRAGSASRLLW